VPSRAAAEDATAKFRRMLRNGELDEREIELVATNVGVDIMTPPGMEEMGQQLRRCSPTSAVARRRHASWRSRPPARC
jgi:ATP-dependent HslUV protease ATP-binding subunit HslU